jgi:hypothetical protein
MSLFWIKKKCEKNTSKFVQAKPEAEIDQASSFILERDWL